MSEAPSMATTYPVADLDRRFYAFAIDRVLSWLLVALAGAGAWFLLDDAWQAIGVGTGMLLVVWLGLTVLVGVTGNTPGKSMVGLRVVHHGTGTPIGVGRALLRSTVLALASLPTFAIGLVTLAWTAVEDRGRQRRGFHDHVAHSVVVDVRPIDHHLDEVDESPRHVVNLTAMRLVPAPPVEAPTLSRRTNTEQSVRRTPMPPQVQHPPVAGPPAAPARPVPLPSVVPASQVAPMTAAPVAQHPARPPADDGRTVVRAKPGPRTGPRWRVTFDNGETFMVEGLALVGRRPEPRTGEQVHHLVPLSSSDMSVSKTHAQFGPATDGALVVMDRGSTNGSVLVRQGVTRPLAPGKPTTLVEGDTVSFGDRQMTISREA